jgi:adenosine kinase
MKKIFISGSVGYDEIMDFPGLFKDYFHPENLHQINVSFAVERLAKHTGGIATNIAYALSRTGAYFKSKQSIYPVAAVGKDGDALLQFFKSNGIAADYVEKNETLFTTSGKVITDENDNQIWGYYYGASKKLDPHFPEPSSPKDGEFWIVSATHERPFTRVLHHVLQNKLSYLFDPGMTLTWIRDDLLKKGILGATYLVGNDYEIAMIEKRIKMTVTEFVKNGVHVIVTLGDKGVRYFDTQSTDTIRVPSYPVKKVVDPTGAGDAWRGGFVGALAAGKPIADCLVMGNVMGSFAVESMGTVEYTPTEKELKLRFQQLIKKLKFIR